MDDELITGQGLQPSKKAADPEVGLSPVPIPAERHPKPTEEERQKLRKVSDHIPVASYALCAVEMAERASYYGAINLFNNFIQFPLPKGGPGTGAIDPSRPNDSAGALGKGLRTASALVLLFWFLAFTSPILGAWIADTILGRFRTIFLGVLIVGVAHVVMVGSAAPSVLAAGTGFPPFMVSFVLLAIGTGIFKANVSAAVVDQYAYQREYTSVLPSGEKVLVDPETTVQRIMLIFYMLTNVGAIFAIAPAYIEKYLGFWQAFLVPTILFLAMPLLLGLISRRTIKRPPQGSEFKQFFRISVIALRENRFNLFSVSFWEKVKPAALAERQVFVTWTNKDIRDVQRTYQAFQIFLYLPCFIMTHNGVGAIRTNQGASLVSNGVPNDLLGNFNAMTIVWFAPLMSHVIYPFLNRHGINFKRIDRMTLGFVLCVLSSVAGGIIQHFIYQQSPCGYRASGCHAPAPISIWVQLSNVTLGGMSEVFCMVTALEMAYARAPPNMKSTVTAMFLFMYALSAALGQLLLPVVGDPTLVWAWIAPAIALFVQTIIFWLRHHHINEEEFMTHEEGADEANLRRIERSSTFSNGEARKQMRTENSFVS